MFTTFLGSLMGKIAIGVCAMLLVALVDRSIRVHNLRNDVAELTDRIENPETGYIARLATCHANVTTLRGSIDEQNAAIDGLKRESAARTAEAEAELAKARTAISAAERRAGTILASRRLPNETSCAHASRLIDEATR